MLGRWGNSEGQLLDCDVLEPLSSCHPKLFLLCLSPLQVQPQRAGATTTISINAMGWGMAPILSSLPELSPPLECRLDPVTLLKRDEMSFT